MKAAGIHFIVLFCSVLLSAVGSGQVKNIERITPLLKNTLLKKDSNDEVQIIVTVKHLYRLHDDKDV